MTRLLTAILLPCVLFVSGCGSDQYALERSYWKITRAAKRIFDNPAGSPPAEVNRVVTMLREFSRVRPDNKLSVEAELNVAHLYFAKKQYENAREQLEAVSERYAAYAGIAAEARWLIGVSYQKEGRQEAAHREFTRLLKDYPDSKRAFVMPLFFVRYYSGRKMDREALSALKEARSYYTSIANQDPATKKALIAELYLARCHIEMKNWEAAAEELDRIYKDYRSTGLNLEGVLFNLALLYLKELNDEAKARQVLATLVSTYPESVYISTARNLVKKMEQVKTP